jgi:CYTH domain
LLGGPRVGRVQASVYRDTYYDRPGHELTHEGREVRVRVIEGPDSRRTLLTYKAPAVDAASGSKPEHETSTGSPAALDASLTGLGSASGPCLAEDPFQRRPCGRSRQRVNHLQALSKEPGP